MASTEKNIEVEVEVKGNEIEIEVEMETVTDKLATKLDAVSSLLTGLHEKLGS